MKKRIKMKMGTEGQEGGQEGDKDRDRGTEKQMDRTKCMDFV